VIDRPNQTWCADITYIPMRRGFLYLVAIMDWYSHKVSACRSTIALGPMADKIIALTAWTRTSALKP
jgi:transposase InsO family protein